MNRRIDDIGKKEKKNIKRIGMFIAIILLAVIGLAVLSNFVGYVYQNYLEGKAGYVYQVVLDYRECATLWSGAFGAAVMVPGYTNQQSNQVTGCGMYDANLLFSCLQTSIPHEVMASQVPPSSIDWGTLQPANPEDVDNYLGIAGSNIMSAERTFLQTATYQIGNTQYIVPATYTKKTNESVPATFDMGILKDGGGNLIFITHILSNFTFGFNNRIYNYQMILPVKNGTSPVYYFFTDPNDVCPQGEGQLPNPGTVEGNVTNSNGDLLPDVIVDVAGRTTLSNANGFYNLSTPSGSYYIFGIKTGYQAYVGRVNVTQGNTTTHNIVMILEAIPNPNTGVGPGQNDNVGPGKDVGPGQDVGPGEAPRVPIIEQPKRIEGVDYVISLSRIDRKLVVGNFLQEIVSFYSYKKGVANLRLSIDGDNLSNMIKLDKTSMAIAPNSNDDLTLTIFGEGVPGDYNGSLVIEGDLNEKIPIHIELLSKDKLPVESLFMQLDVADKSIYSSQKLKFTTNLHNLLSDQSYPVNLQYTIQNSKGETIWSDISNVYLQTSFSLLKTAQLPVNTPTGDYYLRVTARYLGLTSGSAETFSVVLPFYDRQFLKLKVWLWIVILLALIVGTLTYILVKRYLKSKKRYSAAVEYGELPKPGPKSAFVGKIAETEHKTYFDLEQFKVHTIVAGATGGGKSVAAQVVVEEALLKNIAVIVFDPTAQWSGMLRKCTDKNMLKLYQLFGMKPTQARSFNGNVRQITNALEVIDVKKYIKPGEIQILALNKLDPKDIDIFVANSVREVFHANFPETPELKLFLVYDEVHRLLPKFGGSGEGFLQIERGCREFRKWGIGILMISQVLADFVGQIKANINTEIQMRTRDEGDLDRIKTKYGVEVLQGLVKASVGSGMVENPAYNRGKPYFVSFRPLLHNTQRLSDEELEKFNKYNELIDDLQFQTEQLEEEKQDVFDLKLQLKLSLDKVKSGNFNMVEIYLQEVIPRMQKMWEKLGKKPKKRELKLIDAKALKDELKKAEESRKEFEKQNPAAQAAEKVEVKKVLKYEKTVSLKDAMNFSNGLTVTSLQELLDVMPNINGATFKNHVNQNKNDIADWIKNKVGDGALAEKLRQAKTTDEYLRILEEDKSKNNKPVEATPQPVAQEASAASPLSTSSSSQPSVSQPSTPPETIEEVPSWKDLKAKIKTMDNDKQITTLEKTEKKYPNDTNVKFSLGLLYQKMHSYDKATQKFKEILDLVPNNTKALYYLGGLMKIQKNYASSLEYFNKYLTIKKDEKINELVEKIKKM
jgi:tetratricopeptide (TPR) repeat protein